MGGSRERPFEWAESSLINIQAGAPVHLLRPPTCKFITLESLFIIHNPRPSFIKKKNRGEFFFDDGAIWPKWGFSD
jgi:hypothetical protein